jgi:hypothetical protein
MLTLPHDIPRHSLQKDEAMQQIDESVTKEKFHDNEKVTVYFTPSTRNTHVLTGPQDA